MHPLAHSPGIPASAQAQGTGPSYVIGASVSTPFLDVSQSLAMISYLDLEPDLLPCLQPGKESFYIILDLSLLLPHQIKK